MEYNLSTSDHDFYEKYSIDNETIYMEKRKSIKEDEVDEIVGTLLDMPVMNLEAQVKRLESEIAMRGVIFNVLFESGRGLNFPAPDRHP